MFFKLFAAAAERISSLKELKSELEIQHDEITAKKDLFQEDANRLLGFGLWVCILKSWVHATVAGVLVAMFIPARGKYDTDSFVQRVGILLDRLRCGEASCGYSIFLNREHLNAVQAIDMACEDVETPLQRIEHALHPWVAYLILPLFALANTGVYFEDFNVSAALSHPLPMGVFAGLVLGKPIDIIIFSLLGVYLFKTELTGGITIRHFIGVGFLGGIGFTMSLFITGLSFTDPQQVGLAKLAVVSASIVSGVVGYIVLKGSSPVVNQHFSDSVQDFEQ